MAFYFPLLYVHVTCVIASAGLFAVRGVGVLCGARWPMVASLRYASYWIDTLLLAAAVTLASVSHQYPFVAPWLTAKVFLLLIYVLCGWFALKRGRTWRVRLLCFLAALATLFMIVSIAMTHDPLGALRAWLP